ncbi:MLP-like protein 34 [Neltuma alba]|uniref:MLP-like protein 34 n=1 Tax=Neltuma alba TaxID=207710 RepID=UPI0010A46135|nr:MLP-like protein 34 [Prosopis alba]
MVSTLEASLELQSSALKFLEIFSTKTYEIATISPDIVQSVEIVSGEWGIAGFTFVVNYTLDGTAQVAKMEASSINLIDLSITFKVIEGDLLDVYNSFTVSLKLTPNVLSGSVLKWTFEYEKPSSDC